MARFSGIPVEQDEQSGGRFGGIPVDDVENSDVEHGARPGRRVVPEKTAGSVARDVASGVLQIGPTAVKGVADILRMATGDRVGTDTSEAMERGMESIRSIVGSDRAAVQRENFNKDMADDSVSIKGALLNNKGALADQLLPTVGSMFLPVGVAGAAGKLATAGKAVQGMDKAAIALRVASAQKVAGVGTVAAQNAADTFAELLEQGISMGDAYKAAGITVPFSIIAGKLTGGGAEGALTRSLTGSGEVKAGVSGFAKAAGQEGAQEVGEEAGQIVGEAVGKNEAPSATLAGKRMAVAGTLGGVMGGSVNLATASRDGKQQDAVPESVEQEHSPLALPAPVYSGTPNDQVLQAQVERENAGRQAQEHADAVYAARAEYEAAQNELNSIKLVNDPAPLQQRINEALGIDQGKLTPAQRKQYESGIKAMLNEPVGIAHDANGHEIPFTMADYIESQNKVRDKQKMLDAAVSMSPAGAEAMSRMQQVSDEEMQQQADIQPLPPVRRMATGTAIVGNQSVNSIPSSMIAQRFEATTDLSEKAAIAEEMQRRGMDVPGVDKIYQRSGNSDKNNADKQINKVADGWAAFPEEMGTLGIPRAEMPQIKAEHRGALTRFVNARGVQHNQETVDAGTLKPTQAEFSPEKVRKAIGFTGGDRSILVSSDSYVLDGHHQWLAKANKGEPIGIIRFGAPISQLMKLAHDFPSSTKSRTSKNKGQQTRDDLVGAIIRVTGGKGISSAMAQDMTGDKAGSANAKVRGLFTNDGWRDAGEIAMLLREQEGYDVRDAEHLSDLVREQASGNPVYSMERVQRDAEANTEKQYRSEIRKRASELGIKTVAVKFDAIERAVLEAQIKQAQDESNAERDAIQAEGALSELDEEQINALLDLATQEDNENGRYINGQWISNDEIIAAFKPVEEGENEQGTDGSGQAISGEASGTVGDRGGEAGNGQGRDAERRLGKDRPGNETSAEGSGNEYFRLASQTNEQAADQFAQQQAAESTDPTKEQADRERDAVPFSMQQQSQPKPQGVQTGLFTADGRVSSEVKPAQKTVAEKAKETRQRRQDTLSVLGQGWTAKDGVDGAKDIFKKRVGVIEVSVMPERTADANFTIGYYNHKTKMGSTAFANTLEEAAKIANQKLPRGGASFPTEASGANPLAEQSPNAGATAAMTPGQSSDSSVSVPDAKGKIEDFGEELGGAKKDRMPSTDVALSDDDIAAQPLSKVSPEKLQYVRNKEGLAASTTPNLLKLAGVVQKAQDLGINIISEADIVNKYGSRYSRGSGQGMAIRDLEAVVDRVSRGLKNLPKVHVMDSPADLSAKNPAHKSLRDFIRKAGAWDDVEGATHEGEIYLFASGLANEERAEHVFATHEVTHYGLRGAVGKDLDQALQYVWMHNKDVRKKAAELRQKIGLKSNIDAVEEVLADLVPGDLLKLTGWRRVVKTVRDWLQSRGFSAMAKRVDSWLKAGMSDQTKADLYVADLVNSAREWVNSGKGSPYMEGTKLADGNLAEDSAKQEKWLTSEAKARGYQSIDDLAEKNYPLFEKLAAKWREKNPGRTDAGRSTSAPIASAASRTSDGEGAGSDTNMPRLSRRGQGIMDKIDSMSTKQGITGDSGREYSGDQRQFFKNVGRDAERQTAIGRTLEYLRNDFWKKMAIGIVDQFRGLRDLNDGGQAYMLARLSKGTAGAVEALLHHGKLSIKDGAYDADQSGGFVERLGVPLHGELDDFMWWVAANRAEKLSTEEREHLFTADDIKAGKSLATGATGFDYTIQTGLQKGKTTRDRAVIYADANRVFNEFQKNALDMAEQSGLIDGATRKYWESEFYVPFYRVSEDDGEFVGVKMGNALVRQQAFKQLKGGTDKLNSDLLSNTLLNWAHLIEASAKNRAAKASLTAAEKVGAAHKATASDKAPLWYMGEITTAIPKGQKYVDDGVEKVSDGTEQISYVGKVEYVVDDPFVLTALTSLEYAGMRNPIMNALSSFKHWLTIGVTASPAFKVRNLIRDSIQAIGTSDLAYNPAGNVSEGYAITDGKTAAKNFARSLVGRNQEKREFTAEYVSALASGGLIRFGTMLEGKESDRVRQLIKTGVKDSSILDSESKWRAFYDAHIDPVVSAYNELGNVSEEINRAALFNQLVKQGKSHAEAALMARDLMDFSMQGSFNTIRFLTQVVPFTNARLQGLYKLGRAAKDNPHKMATVTGAVALASIALMLAYGDDDDWKRREDWDRDNFWWFKFAGIEYRIPKPFEIGAVASLAERGLEYMINDEMTGERFRKVVSDLIGNNLSMNPVPQAIKPIVDLYANKDSFTGRPIESIGMQRLDSTMRYNSGTSMTARAASQAMFGALSPVQVDHLVRGYFGWLGAFANGSADMAWRAVSDEPTKPSRDYWKFSTQGILKEAGTGSSRYVTMVYDQAAELEKAHATYRQLLKEGKLEEADEYKSDNADKLRRYRMVNHVKQAQSKLNERIRMIERSDIDAGDKKTQIEAIQRRKEDIAKRIVPGIQ